jgi:hypothetical protein
MTNDIPCLMAARFSSWNHMEPLLRFPARQLTNTASIRKYMVCLAFSAWVWIHTNLQRNHAIATGSFLPIG